MHTRNTTSRGELLTLDEARDQLRIGKDLFYRLIRKGDLPSLKIGARRFIKQPDLNAYLERQRQLERPGGHYG